MPSFYSQGLGMELSKLAADFVNGPANFIAPIHPAVAGEAEPVFSAPLVGFAAADDPIWLTYKEKDIIGPHHWTPLEAFNLAFPAETVFASELTVMSWILPQTPATHQDQAKLKEFTSERWVRSRITGEAQVNVGLGRYLQEEMGRRGIQALMPQLLPQWYQLKDAMRRAYSSCWSERHAAHAAGMGTFGLCDGLITPAGKAHRAGSIIVRQKISPTPRLYSQYQEYCLYYSSGACGACMKRCPAGALSAQGHDKARCYDYLWEVSHVYVRKTWDFDGYGCGLCQVGVPCARRIPPKSQKQAAGV